MEKQHPFNQDQIQDPPDIQPADEVFIPETESTQRPLSQESSYYLEEDSEDADSDVTPFQVSSAMPIVGRTDDDTNPQTLVQSFMRSIAVRSWSKIARQFASWYERLCEKRPFAFKQSKEKWRDTPKETPLHTASEQPRSSAVSQTNEWGAKFLATTLVVTVITVVSGFLWLTVFAQPAQTTVILGGLLFLVGLILSSVFLLIRSKRSSTFLRQEKREKAH
jgi:hypothetical protein